MSSLKRLLKVARTSLKDFCFLYFFCEWMKTQHFNWTKKHFDSYCDPVENLKEAIFKMCAFWYFEKILLNKKRPEKIAYSVPCIVFAPASTAYNWDIYGNCPVENLKSFFLNVYFLIFWKLIHSKSFSQLDPCRK